MPQSIALHHYAGRLQRLLAIINEIKTTAIPPPRSASQYITETRWHTSQQIDDLPDGSFLFTVKVSEPREVGWWVLQWGANAEVLEPESLRQEMAETAKALVTVYEK